MESRTADGDVWRRLWSLPDRLVVEFYGDVLFEVRDTDGGIVMGGPLASDLEQHLVLDHVLPLVLARRGEMVLHGAVVSLGERAAVLMGPTGSGKSTLTAFAGQRGWTVGGDDGAVLDLGPPLTAEPTYSTVRLLPDALGLLGMHPAEGTEVVGKRRLDGAGPEPFRLQPAPLTLVAVVHPVDADQPAALHPLRGVDAHAALFRNTFHLDLGGGRSLSAVVDRLACVADSVRIAVLDVPRGQLGLVAAERELRIGLSGAQEDQ
ncbi:hypothetical protein [Blastococcus sp. SYSU D00820]